MIWAVYNGWMGAASTCAIVEAETEDLARDLGSVALHLEERQRAKKLGRSPRHAFGEVERVELLELPAVVDLDH